MRVLLFCASAFFLSLTVTAEESNKSGKLNESHSVATSGEVAKIYAKFDYKAHEISLERFIKIASDANTVILDLRSEKAFKKGHVKGALHLGADVTKEKLARIVPSSDATILVYCYNSLFPSRMIALTHTLVPQIYALGYPNVYFLPMPTTNVLEKLPWEGSGKDIFE